MGAEQPVSRARQEVSLIGSLKGFVQRNRTSSDLITERPSPRAIGQRYVHISGREPITTEQLAELEQEAVVLKLPELEMPDEV